MTCEKCCCEYLHTVVCKQALEHLFRARLRVRFGGVSDDTVHLGYGGTRCGGNENQADHRVGPEVRAPGHASITPPVSSLVPLLDSELLLHGHQLGVILSPGGPQTHLDPGCPPRRMLGRSCFHSQINTGLAPFYRVGVAPMVQERWSGAKNSTKSWQARSAETWRTEHFSLHTEAPCLWQGKTCAAVRVVSWTDHFYINGEKSDSQTMVISVWIFGR